MKILEISGGIPLNGDVCIGGAKNASMPIIIASLLSKQNVLIHNIPHVLDVVNLLQILKYIGVNIAIDGNHTDNPSKTISLSSNVVQSCIVNPERTQKIRTSILLLGPLLARNGYVKLAQPGGCDIGDRKIDLHISAMRKLGAEVNEVNGCIEAKTVNGKLKGAEIEFSMISVGATENTIMAAVLADGRTILKNVAIEPEISDLISFLNKSGAKIQQKDGRVIIIDGVSELKEVEYSIMPDRIEAATYAMFAAITGGRIKMHYCPMNMFDCVAEVFHKVGVNIVPFFSENGVEGVIASRSEMGTFPVEIETNPYPLFPTDIQPQLMTLLALTNGKSIITENIFENRLQHAIELKKLGADITIDGRRAIINGVKKFHSGTVTSTDLRAGTSLMMAGLASKAKIIIHKAEYIDRGYQMIAKNLQRLGADINVIVE
ncbi:MAG: UDP-N-acetylglucosamine 1-carboxyvinyltransferase [Candidatus Deianiraeaceae bacterium]|jgi:UDP-N-acetylglucosamine 1-carboxyvinyltransferase